MSTALQDRQGTTGDSAAVVRHRRATLSITTLGVFLAFVNSSIVLISLPAVFRGLKLNPLEPGNVGYLLWLLTGYSVVTAVLVVLGGRLGDVLGRSRAFTIGFGIFTFGALLCALTPSSGGNGALELILFRAVQGVGGALLTANSTALITDAYPPDRRGAAVGINQVAAIGGSFLGLLAGGLIADHSWRLVFFASVPFGVVGTLWAMKTLKDLRPPRKVSLDPWGNVAFGLGLVGVLSAMTYGVQPYHGHVTGWTNPYVLGALIGGIVLLGVFARIETRVAQPMFDMKLFKNRAFAAGNIAGLLASLARGGLQFMLIIWLQGIWLPEHGYSYESTPLWAGIYLLPLTIGFLVAGPVSGSLSDRFGARPFATGGMIVTAGSFLLLLTLPADFNYVAFAALLALNGLGSGLFASPNTTGIMNSVPANERGAASGMRATFQNSGQVLSIGLFFTLLVVGLAGSLPTALQTGLTGAGVPAATAATASSAPPVATLFAAFLGYNPVQTLLGPSGATLQAQQPQVYDTVTSKSFFPHVIGDSFMHGLTVVFILAAVLCLIGAAASWLRGGKFVHGDTGTEGGLPGTDLEQPGDLAIPAEAPDVELDEPLSVGSGRPSGLAP